MQPKWGESLTPGTGNQRGDIKAMRLPERLFNLISKNFYEYFNSLIHSIWIFKWLPLLKSHAKGHPRTSFESKRIGTWVRQENPSRRVGRTTLKAQTYRTAKRGPAAPLSGHLPPTFHHRFRILRWAIVANTSNRSHPPPMTRRSRFMWRRANPNKAIEKVQKVWQGMPVLWPRRWQLQGQIV